MPIYSLLVAVHVITAVFGLGPLTALAIIVARPGAAEFGSSRVLQFLRAVSWGLIGMLITGIALVAMTRGALGHTFWIRASLALFVLAGALLGYAKRLVRRTLATEALTIPVALGRVVWATCIVVAAIIYLMEVKPS